MNFDIIFHGSPKGKDYYGVSKEQLFINQFHTIPTDAPESILKFSTKTEGKNTFFYYTLLKYKNVFEFEGRSGSYFGLTLRLDIACINIENIYNMLQNIYRKHIVGLLVSENQGNTKYIVSSFKDKENEIKTIEQNAAKYLQLYFSESDFQNINVSHAQQGCRSMHLIDARKNFVNLIAQYSSIALSYDYPSQYMLTMKDEHQRELKRIDQESITKIKKIQEDLSHEQKRGQQLQNEIDRLKSDIQSKEANIKQKDQEIKQLNDEIAKISDPFVKGFIQTIQDQVTKQVSQKDKKKHNKTDSGNSRSENFNKRKIWPIIIGIALIALIALVILLFNSRPDTVENKPKANIEESTDENVGMELQTPIGTFSEKIAKEVRDKKLINIQGYNGFGPLESKKEYIAQIRGGYSGGKWKFEGAVDNGPTTDGQKFTPTSNRVSIKYIVTRNDTIFTVIREQDAK